MDDFLKEFFPSTYRRKQAHLHKTDYCKYDNQLLTLFTSSLYLAGLISTFGASLMTRKYGRNRSIMVGAVSFFLGGIINVAAVNIDMMIISRILLGIGIGFENHISCRVDTYRLKPRGLGSIMKLKVVCRKAYDYVRYDLKEIAFPSSLPDPPHIKKRRKITLIEWWYVMKEASRLYAASSVRDIDPDLRPNHYKKYKADDGKPRGEAATVDKREPSALEDLAVAARGGMETLRPALQRVYMTRASAYRDALKSFIQGYQEGIQEVVEAKEDSKPQPEDDAPKKSS